MVIISARPKTISTIYVDLVFQIGEIRLSYWSVHLYLLIRLLILRTYMLLSHVYILHKSCFYQRWPRCLKRQLCILHRIYGFNFHNVLVYFEFGKRGSLVSGLFHSCFLYILRAERLHVSKRIFAGEKIPKLDLHRSMPSTFHTTQSIQPLNMTFEGYITL